MHITVQYHAMLREQRGCDSEQLELPNPSLSALYRRLRRAFAFSVPIEHVRPAINDEFCTWERPIADGDCVVFVPPVSGG